MVFVTWQITYLSSKTFATSAWLPKPNSSFKLAHRPCSLPIFILDFALFVKTSLRFLLLAESVKVAGLPRFDFVLVDIFASHMTVNAQAQVKVKLEVTLVGRSFKGIFVGATKNNKVLKYTKYTQNYTKDIDKSSSKSCLMTFLTKWPKYNFFAKIIEPMRLKTFIQMKILNLLMNHAIYKLWPNGLLAN